MSFKVQIINNENNEVLVDEEEAVAIVGAITNEQGTRSVGYTRCNLLSLMSAISGASKVIEEFQEENPMLGAMLAFAAQMEEKEEKGE